MEKLAYTVDEGRRALGVGRTSFYALINAGELESFKACGRTLVAAESLQAFVDRARAASANPALGKPLRGLR
jgi:hypothetical protein